MSEDQKPSQEKDDSKGFLHESEFSRGESDPSSQNIFLQIENSPTEENESENESISDFPELPEDLEFAPLPVFSKNFWAPTLQQLVGAAERLKDKKIPGFTENTDWMTLVEQTRDRLLREEFEAFPLSGFIQRKNNKERILAVTHPADRLVQEAILPLLVNRVESISLPCSHAFRRGRGTFTAALAAQKALQSMEKPWICIVDIADFFPSVDLELLRRDLQWAPERMVFIIFQFLQAPVRMRGREIHLTGLPLGCALSPILSNLYLQSVDEAMQTANGVYLRYADDILLIASDQTSLNGMMENLTRALEARRLRLKQEKTQRFEFDGTPFAWLGHFLDRNGIYDRISEKRLERIEARSKDAAAEAEKIATPSDSSASVEAAGGLNERYRTVYITGHGIYVQVRDGYIECRKGDHVLRRVALHRVNRVVYMATGSFSSGFFASCINRRIPIVYYSGKGKGYAILIPEGNINALRLRAQFDLRSDPVRRLAVARSILQSKCDAMIHRIGSSPHFKDSVEKIRNYRERMNEASHISSLVGLEGTASQEYFRVFRRRILKVDFDFFKRTKRPPMDPINSLMSFVYALLFSEFETCLLFHGLDPHPGFLHELHRAHAALASDLMEPYRAIIADPFVLRLVNQGTVRVDGFEKQQGGAVYMNNDTRRTVLQAYEKYMCKPLGGKPSAGTPRQLVYGAVNAMLSLILGESEELQLPLDWQSCIKREPYIEVVGEDIRGMVPDGIRIPDENAAAVSGNGSPTSGKDSGSKENAPAEPEPPPPPYDPNVDT